VSHPPPVVPPGTVVPLRPPARPQPQRPATAAVTIIDRLNAHAPFVEVDVLPGEEPVVTSDVLRRALLTEARTRHDSAHEATRARAPRGWRAEDVDVGLAGFNSDGSVRFVATRRAARGGWW
jgi:hypothetical protein